MITAAAVYHAFHFFNLTVQIRNVCVLLAPWFASNTAIATYLFTSEAFDKVRLFTLRSSIISNHNFEISLLLFS
jgi:hypothetical protein